jgi:hypothetical protein
MPPHFSLKPVAAALTLSVFPMRRYTPSATAAGRLPHRRSPVSRHPHRRVLGLSPPHSLHSHVGHRHRRFGLPKADQFVVPRPPHPRLRRLDVAGEDFPLVPHSCLTVRVLKSRCRAIALCNRAAVGHARHCAASCVGTVQAGCALKPAHGLSFIFLFSEFSQIYANSKICTSLI